MKTGLAKLIAAWCPAGLILAGFLTASPAPTLGDEWGETTGRPPAGVSALRWNRLLTSVQEQGYSLRDIAAYLAIIELTAQEDLPIEAVLTRLEEGVAKQAEPAALEGAGRQRLTALRQARLLLEETGYSAPTASEQQGVLTAVAYALESGVTRESLAAVLRLAATTHGCRLRTSIEAGETLTLMGLDQATVAGLMEDFVTRQLCCGEILRATRLVGQQHRAGQSGPDIRSRLWAEGAVTAAQCRRARCNALK